MSAPADFWFYNRRFAAVPGALCSAAREMRCIMLSTVLLCRGTPALGRNGPFGAGVTRGGGDEWRMGPQLQLCRGWGARGKETRVS